MTVKTSALGGSGTFIAKFASSTILVAIGQTGTFITLTPPSGQRVKLAGLASQSSVLTSLTTVSVGGVAVISDALLEGAANTPNATNQLMIGYAASNQSPITGEVDEVISISTNVATSAPIVYAYQFGV